MINYRNIRIEYTSAINSVSWLSNLEKLEFSKKIESIKLVTNASFLEIDALLLDQYNNVPLIGCFITNNNLLKHLKRRNMYAKMDVIGDDPKNLWSFLIEPLGRLPQTIIPLKTIGEFSEISKIF